jgi:predicted metal-dependent HD superfamily phosphohydrolase
MNAPTRESLETRWLHTLSAFTCPPAAARRVFANLARRYAEPERHYHTLDHVASVLDTMASLLPEREPSPALALAAWFHDAIYDTRTSDNEDKSAQLARTLLEPLHVPEVALREVTRLILLTKTHAPEEDDQAGKVLIDADLAILGAREDIYDQYARAIRSEYAWVPEKGYRAGRRRVLEGFLARPRIYRTEEMFSRAEEQARLNVRRELAALG